MIAISCCFDTRIVVTGVTHFLVYKTTTKKISPSNKYLDFFSVNMYINIKMTLVN